MVFAVSGQSAAGRRLATGGYASLVSSWASQATH
jgi:hypothetical protein